MNTKIWTSLDLVGVLLAAMAGVSHAGTYYVATDGSTDNDGLYAKPWPSVAVALEKVGGGHTIALKRGKYRGPITVTAEAAGTERNPTIIKSERKWEAAIVGSTGENPAMSNDKDPRIFITPSVMRCRSFCQFCDVIGSRQRLGTGCKSISRSRIGCPGCAVLYFSFLAT